jgi:imidazolonepropionase-like amidohydrolase
MVRRLLLALLICLCAVAVAQEPKEVRPSKKTAPAEAAPAKVTLIRAGRLIDVRSGQVLENQAILIEGDRIQEVGPAEGLAAPAGARVIDLSRATVLPGLVDCHEHLLGNPKDLSATAALRMTSAQKTLWGVRNLHIWLSQGFTTLRDAGETDLGYGQVALRDSVAKGLITGPRIVTAGNFVSITGGHGDADALGADQALPRRPNIADNVEEVGDAVHHDLKYGVDWIKLMATGGVMDPFSDFNTQELSEAQMARAVEIAHRARRKVMAHAEGTEGIKAAVRAGVDSIEHGTMLDEEGATLMAEHGTWLVPTLNTFQRGVALGTSLGQDPVMAEKGKAILKYQQAAFTRAVEHHVKIAYGVDDDPDFASKEFGALVRGGMTPLGALQAATINGASLLGLEDQVGTIEAGKYADIIAVAGDPLRDITVMEHVAFVMKGGEVWKNEVGK